MPMARAARVHSSREAGVWSPAGANTAGELIYPQHPPHPSPLSDPEKEHQCLQSLKTLPHGVRGLCEVSFPYPKSLMLS